MGASMAVPSAWPPLCPVPSPPLSLAPLNPNGRTHRPAGSRALYSREEAPGSILPAQEALSPEGTKPKPVLLPQRFCKQHRMKPHQSLPNKINFPAKLTKVKLKEWIVRTYVTQKILK